MRIETKDAKKGLNVNSSSSKQIICLSSILYLIHTAHNILPKIKGMCAVHLYSPKFLKVLHIHSTCDNTEYSRLILVSCQSNPCLKCMKHVYGFKNVPCFNVPFYGWGLVNNKKCLCHVLFPFPFVLHILLWRSLEKWRVPSI